MDLLLRFQGGFGVESGPNSYSQDTIIMMPQDVAEKSGRFETDFVVNVTVPPGSMNRFLHPTCDEDGNPLGNCHFDGTCEEDGNLLGVWHFDGDPLGGWYLDVPAVLAEWAEANYPLNWELAVTNCQLNYPLNWELGVASDLTDSELAEQARLDELYDARLAELELYEEARLAEMQLADWEEAVHLADLYDAHLADLFEKDQLVENQLAEANEWAEEARIAGCSTEGAPYSWNYDVQ